MRKLFYLFLLFVAGVAVSCSASEDGDSDAWVTYGGEITTISSVWSERYEGCPVISTEVDGANVILRYRVNPTNASLEDVESWSMIRRPYSSTKASGDEYFVGTITAQANALSIGEIIVTLQGDSSFFVETEYTYALCSNYKDGGQVVSDFALLSYGTSTVTPDNGIPSDSEAESNPDVDAEDITNQISGVTAVSVEGLDDVWELFMLGIIDELGNGLELYGTGDSRQNVWIEIDGVAKGILVINVGDSGSDSQAKIDLVFLVDNSGSMGEEANQIAEDISEWANYLSTVADMKFGCVGYGYSYGYVYGAVDMTTSDVLDEYLNRSGYTGTKTTYGYYGDNATYLSEQAALTSYYRASAECGVLALRFADELFDFRSSATRYYVNFTDEPNQYGSSYTRYSAETLNINSTTYAYDWSSSRGIIHSVISGNYDYAGSYADKAYLLSTYTNGTILEASSSFTGVTLYDLPITEGIKNSYQIRLMLSDSDPLSSGVHEVRITVKSADGSVAADNTFYVTFE